MRVGCYSLDLYCSRSIRAGKKESTCLAPWNQDVIQTTGHTLRDCLKAAREAGWKVSPEGKELCPYCIAGKSICNYCDKPALSRNDLCLYHGED